MIGKELAGRYEILGRIGGGGMALVYKGLDMLLNRKVAVKVLRQQFVHDDEFIHRFRREAQSAASLSHPNVVSIYDVGKEDDIHYIVMEYVEGMTLKDLIQERAPLPVEQAVHIAMQIADALDHAHHNQIIHRDIKPHNILIGKNGRVKVTDFGIARAVTSTTITYTGSVIGSVHYFSPEHAKGIMTGEKSDIYSLGIVLYEMLTGELPFSGESPISVALKHLQDKVKPPREINPLIPQSVENIILRSMMKDPVGRYDSAKEMLEDLDTCLQPGRLHEPKIQIEEQDDLDKTIILPAIGADVQNTLVVDGEDDFEEEEERSGRAQKWIKPVIWISVLIAFLFITFYSMKWLAGIWVVPEVEVPPLVGIHRDVAQMKLETLKLEPDIKERHDESVEKDYVIKQGTYPGMVVKEGSPIELFVSLGPETSEMEELIGKTLSEANLVLNRLGIKDDQIMIKEEHNKDVAPGTVIEHYPRAGEQFVTSRVQVELTVSKGKSTFKMPKLIGLKEGPAENLLIKHDLVLGKKHRQATYEAEKGIVYKQFPYDPEAEVSPGESIDIWISDGYPPEAKVVTDRISVGPATEGQASEIVIIVTDARGDNMEIMRRTITATEELRFQVVLSPTKNAFVKVFQDQNLINSHTIDYSSVSD